MHLVLLKCGTWVEPGDTLVGKISPQKESENTPEGRLLRAIFGGTARDVKDTPLTVPSGVTGRVLETRTLFENKLFITNKLNVQNQLVLYMSF